MKISQLINDGTKLVDYFMSKSIVIDRPPFKFKIEHNRITIYRQGNYMSITQEAFPITIHDGNAKSTTDGNPAILIKFAKSSDVIITSPNTELSSFDDSRFDEFREIAEYFVNAVHPLFRIDLFR